MNPTSAVAPPEHNVTGIDYTDRRHFRHSRPPIIDIHAHVFQTRPGDPKSGPPLGTGPDASLDQAEVEIEVDDSGTGVSASTTARLFVPFARGVTRDGPTGSGLGS